MAQYDSLAVELEVRGGLSLRKFVQYLQQYHPHVSFSYPTMLKMIKEGKIEVIRVGGQYRVTLDEAQRYIKYGNKPPPDASAASSAHNGEPAGDDGISSVNVNIPSPAPELTHKHLIQMGKRFEK